MLAKADIPASSEMQILSNVRHLLSLSEVQCVLCRQCIAIHIFTVQLGVITVAEFRKIGFNNALEVEWNEADTKCLIKARYK